MTVPPEPDCWLHPDVEVRRSPIAGHGLFATGFIGAGTVVSRLGGQLVSGRRLRELLAGRDARSPYLDTITVDEDRHLVLPPRRPNGYGNHGCEPNLWLTGPYELAARHDLTAGVELTNDYATSTAEPEFRLDCSCGSARCRLVITGRDWQRPDLQQEYGPHWVPALLALIESGRAR